VPWLGWLIALVGAIYGIYLLYLGLPYTMKCPPDKAAGYTTLSVVITVVLVWIIAAIIGTAMFGGAAMMGGRHHMTAGTAIESYGVDPLKPAVSAIDRGKLELPATKRQ
jgi:hypothetical protein